MTVLMAVSPQLYNRVVEVFTSPRTNRLGKVDEEKIAVKGVQGHSPH